MKTIKAGVIGHPIAHSKSPLIHGYWLAYYGIDGEYKTYDIAPETLEEGIKELVECGLSGFNVTLPHKQKMLSLCDTLSDEARGIGAVNTVRIDGNGKLYGHNTDAFGFAQNLDEIYPDFDWTNTTATVIGAGGAARAILYALKSKSVKEICLTNRTHESAIELAALYQARVAEWDNRNEAVKGSGLIINTTSLGMKGQNALDIDLTGLADNAIVYDIVYNPLKTPFLQQAEKNGARLVTGIGMLLHQARPAFDLWFGQYPEVTKELEERLLAA